MNGIQGAKFGGHGLAGAVEDARVNLDEFQGVNQRKNGRASPRDLDIRKIHTQSEPIKCAQTLGRDETPRSISRHSGNAFACPSATRSSTDEST
jgi:hypothetical protein